MHARADDENDDEANNIGVEVVAIEAFILFATLLNRSFRFPSELIDLLTSVGG